VKTVQQWARFQVVVTVVVVAACFGQTPVDLGNGFKPYGSYDGGSLDSVSLHDGNFLLHLPIIRDYLQRGGRLSPQLLLYLSSHNWIGSSLGGHGFWTLGGSTLGLSMTTQLAVKRTVIIDNESGLNYTANPPTTLTTWDGASHGLTDISGGNQTIFQTMDATGYRVLVSNPDQYGIPQDVTVIARDGARYLGTWGGDRCSKPVQAPPYNVGGYAIIYDNFLTSPTVCTEQSITQRMVDANGNQMVLGDPAAAANVDTMGRPSFQMVGSFTSDSSQCSSALPFVNAVLESYKGPDGAVNTIKVCLGTLQLHTNFGVANRAEVQDAGNNVPITAQMVTTIVLADGSRWLFAYDTYANVTSITLPSGGSINYT